MKFTPDGPDIPTDLLNASVRGKVVFLCGAGVSQPAGLPNFKTLTQRVFEHLGLEMDGAEKFAFGQQRYEEVMGSLSRRVANRRSIYRAIKTELHADRVQNTAAHSTILRLSRDFEGKPDVAPVVRTDFPLR
jgi:NAD-dependent SIR2 family protein deacetylase